MLLRDLQCLLGELYGIESSYTDFWRRRRRVSPATERALLTAMGVAVGSPREVEDSLREAEARPWRRMLAPVRVIAPPAPVEITFTLPGRLAGTTIEWTLTQEGGEVDEGALVPDDLPLVEKCVQLATERGFSSGENVEWLDPPVLAELAADFERRARVPWSEWAGGPR